VSFLNSKVQLESPYKVKVKMSTGAGLFSTVYTTSYTLSKVCNPAMVKKDKLAETFPVVAKSATFPYNYMFANPVVPGKY